MAYVIAEPCIGTKDNSCVEVCPVDCIHPTPDEPDYDKVEMLYIDPEECIDCDACVEACPVDACFAEDQLPEEWQKYTQINADYYTNQELRPAACAPVRRRMRRRRAAHAPPRLRLGHRQRHADRLRRRGRRRRLHHRQLDRRERDQPAGALAQRLRGRIVGVGETSGRPASDCSRSAIVSGTLASSGTSSSSASSWPPPSPKIWKRSPPG